MSMKIPRMLSIRLLRENYLSNKITPEEVINTIISRANEDKEMNIWITPPSMERIKPYLEDLEKLDPHSCPLWGIPFAVKDNIDLAGIETTAGCPDYAYLPKENATIVERLVASGAIPVGKTNLDQFATGLVGTRSPYGETHNALREELISGGSSSGSAVAVARGHAAFALGTDTAGSGRVPAALNNLVGYKPSLGAWPIKGVVPACVSLDCVTVFTHDLEDTMIVDSIARGYDEQDPWSRNIPIPFPKLPEKIYLPKEEPKFFGLYADGYKKAWENSVQKLKELDIPIEYKDCRLFSEVASMLYDGPWIAERWADLGGFVHSHLGSIFPVTEHVLRSGASEKLNAASVFTAMHRLQEIKLAIRKILKNTVLVMPTAGGTWTRDQVRENPISTNSDMGRYTNHCNLLDLCAVAIPAGKAAENTPFGITLFSLSENEGLILGTAHLFQNDSSVKELFPSKNINTTLVAVCGLHMRGFSLEQKMHECGAHFVREDRTAEKYQFVKLPTIPTKPGLIKQQAGGSSIHLEIWEMPLSKFGTFVTSIPKPLGIGKIELQDGSEVPGFICESYAEADAEDISSLGGWRNTSMKSTNS